MANHQMLQAGHRPPWRVVTGGSSSYVQAIAARLAGVACAWRCPVRRVRREADGGRGARRDAGDERFDQVVLACHSDQALALLADPSAARARGARRAFATRRNDTVLHTDARLLPRNRKAWAAWNAYVPAEPGAACTVSYCMNLLQGLDAPRAVRRHASTAAQRHRPGARCWRACPTSTRSTRHASVAAQARRAEISGVNRTWYAGAYWGFGFHEDGLRSGVRGRPRRSGVRVALSEACASAIYEGWVRHRRARPRAARLPLPHVPAVPRPGRARPGVRRPLAVVGGPAQPGAVPPHATTSAIRPLPLDDAVRDRVEAEPGTRPTGPIRLLTHGRYFG